LIDLCSARAARAAARCASSGPWFRLGSRRAATFSATDGLQGSRPETCVARSSNVTLVSVGRRPYGRHPPYWSARGKRAAGAGEGLSRAVTVFINALRSRGHRRALGECPAQAAQGGEAPSAYRCPCEDEIEKNPRHHYTEKDYPDARLLALAYLFHQEIRGLRTPKRFNGHSVIRGINTGTAPVPRCAKNGWHSARIRFLLPWRPCAPCASQNRGHRSGSLSHVQTETEVYGRGSATAGGACSQWLRTAQCNNLDLTSSLFLKCTRNSSRRTRLQRRLSGASTPMVLGEAQILVIFQRCRYGVARRKDGQVPAASSTSCSRRPFPRPKAACDRRLASVRKPAVRSLVRQPVSWRGRGIPTLRRSTPLMVGARRNGKALTARPFH